MADNDYVEYQAEPRWLGMVEISPEAITASALNVPIKPPAAWFANPDLSVLTPLTVNSSGQVFGHIASWKGSHIGRLGNVKPPKSRSGYQYFRTGVVEAEDGSMVPVGQITLVGGHAPLDVPVQAAVAHYDNTNSAVMDVAVGEDQHGIWVAGALRPDVDDLKIRAIRASSVSGDWRPIDNSLELVAICSVNVPGFPIPRALAAAGDAPGEAHLYALVAAGTEELTLMAHEEPTLQAVRYLIDDIELKMTWMRTAMMAITASAMLDDVTDDLTEYEEDLDGTVALDEPEVPEAADASATESEVADPEDRLAADDTDTDDGVDDVADVTRDEVVDAAGTGDDVERADDDDVSDGLDDTTDDVLNDQYDDDDFAFTNYLDREMLAKEIVASGHADTLWTGDNLPIHFSCDQVEAVALRLRVRGMTAGAQVDIDPRRAALVTGAAMPDGRLPIQSVNDLRKAVLVVPEDTLEFDHLVRRSVALGVDIDAVRRDAIITAAAATKEKYDFGTRLKMSKSGTAMSGGQYPIADEEDLRNAIQAIGRAKDKAATKAHIMKRARALNLVKLLPEKWSD